MPHIYITDEAKQALDELIIKEHRTLSKEVEFLIAQRANELNSITNNTSEQDLSKN